MNGNQTEAFIAALSEWASLEPKVQDYDTLLYLLGFRLGIRDMAPSPESLRQRIEELVEDQNLSEDLLITGLVHDVTYHLQRNLSRHGQSILYQERILEEHPGAGPSERALEKLRNLGYVVWAQSEVDEWLAIVATKFSVSNRESWERERSLAVSDSFLTEMKQVPQEIREVIAGIPVGKLFDRVQVQEIKNLSLAEALELRRQILNDE